jgi:hypothetical protein
MKQKHFQQQQHRQIKKVGYIIASPIVFADA